MKGFAQNNFFLTFPHWILIYTGEILIIIIGERAGDSSSNVISLDPKLPLSFFPLTKIVCPKKEICTNENKSKPTYRLNTIMAISPIEIIIKIVENFPSLINNLR